ncbi:MAG: tRNA guanosine(34) transglycosylase Tgt [Kofleriaceae bacterium]
MFEVVARSGRARLGRLTTMHGVIETPVFMPVGTRGTVRTQTLPQVQALGAPILLGNTYHLMLRPGIDVFGRFGGLHAFMGWTGSILTDSGGFQVFSLAHRRTIDDSGAAFQDVEDGPRTVLSPESSIAMQRAIGSDIMMVMDHCVDATCSEAEARDAMDRTHRWAKRSLAARGDSPQQLFAIVQGARFMAKRRESAETLVEIGGFDGYAIGGLAVGEERDEREAITELVAGLLPEDKPRYLMGVGTPADIRAAVARGVDMFDCIMPTAWAQHGRVFTSTGDLDLRKGLFKFSDERLDPACRCEACTLHTRAYLHHLVKCQEPLGWQLLANHNLHHYVRLMATIREEIRAASV